MAVRLQASAVRGFIFSEVPEQSGNADAFSSEGRLIPRTAAMPVLTENGYCLHNEQQEEEEDCTLKNAIYASYLGQGNLQGLRSSWAARTCLISEFLLYLTDYQGEGLQLQGS
jgi:hypothetical protein